MEQSVNRCIYFPATFTYLQTPTPTTSSTKGWHLFVFLVELLQIRGLCRGHLIWISAAFCFCWSETVGDVPAVQVADPRPNVFKVGERTCGQSLSEEQQLEPIKIAIKMPIWANHLRRSFSRVNFCSPEPSLRQLELLRLPNLYILYILCRYVRKGQRIYCFVFSVCDLLMCVVIHPIPANQL